MRVRTNSSLANDLMQGVKTGPCSGTSPITLTQASLTPKDSRSFRAQLQAAHGTDSSEESDLSKEISAPTNSASETFNIPNSNTLSTNSLVYVFSGYASPGTQATTQNTSQMEEPASSHTQPVPVQTGKIHHAVSDKLTHTGSENVNSGIVDPGEVPVIDTPGISAEISVLSSQIQNPISQSPLSGSDTLPMTVSACPDYPLSSTISCFRTLPATGNVTSLDSPSIPAGKSPPLYESDAVTLTLPQTQSSNRDEFSSTLKQNEPDVSQTISGTVRSGSSLLVPDGISIANVMLSKSGTASPNAPVQTDWAAITDENKKLVAPAGSHAPEDSTTAPVAQTSFTPQDSGPSLSGNEHQELPGNSFPASLPSMAMVTCSTVTFSPSIAEAGDKTSPSSQVMQTNQTSTQENSVSDVSTSSCLLTESPVTPATNLAATISGQTEAGINVAGASALASPQSAFKRQYTTQSNVPLNPPLATAPTVTEANGQPVTHPASGRTAATSQASDSPAIKSPALPLSLSSPEIFPVSTSQETQKTVLPAIAVSDGTTQDNPSDRSAAESSDDRSRTVMPTGTPVATISAIIHSLSEFQSYVANHVSPADPEPGTQESFGETFSSTSSDSYEKKALPTAPSTLSMIVQTDDNIPVRLTLDTEGGVATSITLESQDDLMTQRLTNSKKELLDAMNSAGVDTSLVTINIVTMPLQTSDIHAGHTYHDFSGQPDFSGGFTGGNAQQNPQNDSSNTRFWQETQSSDRSVSPGIRSTPSPLATRANGGINITA